MFCCENCFNDVHARQIIKDYGIKGTCSFCESSCHKVIDLSIENQLSSAFINLLNSYELSNDEREGKNLVDSIKEWNILNIQDYYLAKSLIQELCISVYDKHDPIYDDAARLYINIDDIKEDDEILSCSWPDFVDHIKHKYRFFNSPEYSGFNPDAFAWWIKNVLCESPKCDILYRARIVHDSNQIYKTDEMGMPPAETCTAGRINPEGIPVLYLSTEKETVFYEVRAYLYEFVCTGYFNYIDKRNIKLVNLSNIDSLSPCSPIIRDSDENVRKLKLNLQNLKEIAKTISKPLRKNDSPLEYIPTQFLAEFIRIQGIMGIIYKSAMYTNGINIALFDSNLVKCYKVEKNEVTDIIYTTK